MNSEGVYLVDPEIKYLYHSFVESPDMLNIYYGNVVTDESGSATVALPEYFDALNTDFRYQFTVIGTFAQAIVSKEVSGNVFSIMTDKRNIKVSWQVTGVRKDPYANAIRIEPEVTIEPENIGRPYLYQIEAKGEINQCEWAVQWVCKSFVRRTRTLGQLRY